MKRDRNKGGHSDLFREDKGGNSSLFGHKSAMSPFFGGRTASAGGWDTHCKRGSFL
jgi:hypothetical protein